MVGTEGLVPGHDPGGEELVPAVLLHALDEDRPVVVVGVHHGGEEVDPLELGEPEPLLTVSHDLALGGNGVEVTVAGRHSY